MDDSPRALPVPPGPAHSTRAFATPGAAETFLSAAQDGSPDGSLKQRVQRISFELDIDTSLPLRRQMEHAFVAMLGRPPSAAEAPPSAAHESTVLALAERLELELGLSADPAARSSA